MRLRPGVLALAVLLVGSGCVSGPPKVDRPPTFPSTRPGTSVPVSPSPLPRGQARAWIAAEEWEGFTRTTLWPQEWALRHWHRWSASAGKLQWNPEATLPPPPAVTPLDLGGDPRWWAVDFPLPLDPSPGRRVSAGSITFPATETGGLPPSVQALRLVLSSRKTGDGLVRVDSVDFDGVRFLVRYSEAGP